jgi:uncharacterized protein (DUF2267 family)
MPITLTQGEVIPNRLLALSARETEATYSVIAALDYDDLWRGPGTLHEDERMLMRVDAQGSYMEGGFRQYNIQVQKNGINGASTVACAIVSSVIQTNNAQNQAGAKNKVISALNQSLDSGRIYTVRGSNP